MNRSFDVISVVRVYQMTLVDLLEFEQSWNLVQYKALKNRDC